MEKKRFIPVPRSKKERIGLPTGLLDCDRNEIMTGDFVRFRSSGYSGPVMWHRKVGCYGVFMGLWYLDKNPYDPDCYGKFLPIPQDNGARMDIERIERSECEWI